MTIDAHQHFWHYDPVRYAWIDDGMPALKRDYLPEALAPELARNGVDATIAVQAEQSEQETEFLLELARKHDSIAGVVGWIDLRSPHVAERLRYFSQFEKLAGFRHIVQDEADDSFLLRPDFLRGLEQLKTYGFTYDLLVYPRQLAAAAQLASRLPHQAFVLDHIGKPEIRKGEIAAWSASVRHLASCPNVYCKLSGIVTEADWGAWTPEQLRPYLDAAFEAFGPARLMYGSDWPVCLLAVSYTQATNLVRDYLSQCSFAEQEAIMGLNAAKFYGIKKTA